MSNFKVGEVVQLASGGPKMTLTSDGAKGGQVCCHWFTRDEELKAADLPEEALVRVSAGYSPSASDDSGRV